MRRALDRWELWRHLLQTVDDWVQNAEAGHQHSQVRQRRFSPDPIGSVTITLPAIVVTSSSPIIGVEP